MAKLYDARSRRAQRRRRGDHGVARAGPAHPRVRLQRDPARQVDRRPAPWLRDLALGAQPRATRRPTRRCRRSIDAAVSRYDVPQRYYRLKAQHARARPALATTTASRRSARTRARSPGTRRVGSCRRVLGLLGRGRRDRRALLRRATGSTRPSATDKRHGAFCATTVPGVHPYVLMNYTGDRRSILTLAHELGHGLHGAARAAARALQRRDAAHDRGDRLGLRRGAHVQAPARARGRPAAAASTCSPAGSRTRSRPCSGRSR